MELICTTILLINMTALRLTNIDVSVINSATISCKTNYNSCVRSITKKEDRVYHTICGTEYKK